MEHIWDPYMFHIVFIYVPYIKLNIFQKSMTYMSETNLSNLMDILMVQFMVCGVILPLRYHTHCCLTSVIGRLDVLSNWWLTPVITRCATSPLKL